MPGRHTSVFLWAILTPTTAAFGNVFASAPAASLSPTEVENSTALAQAAASQVCVNSYLPPPLRPGLPRLRMFPDQQTYPKNFGAILTLLLQANLMPIAQCRLQLSFLQNQRSPSQLTHSFNFLNLAKHSPVNMYALASFDNSWVACNES